MTTYVLDQLAGHTMGLYRVSFNHMDELEMVSQNKVVPGPPVDETQWTAPDTKEYWPANATFTDLNPESPTGYSSLTEYTTAYIDCHIRAITVHAALQFGLPLPLLGLS